MPTYAFNGRNRLCRRIASLILLVASVVQANATETRELVIERSYTDNLTYRCIVTLPPEYESDLERSWPMILFLHGGGSPQPEQLERSVIGLSMGGSGAWELPSFEPTLFSKSVVIAGVCHPWSLRHYPMIPVWVFVGADDYMRKEQPDTVTSAKRFGVDVVETVCEGTDHGGIFKNAMADQRMLDWHVADQDLRLQEKNVK